MSSLKNKNFFKRESVIITLIILLAYILRILPYLLGYNLPLAEEGMWDFAQVKYLIANNQINFGDDYFHYGSFPLLHLLVFGIAKLGFDPLQTFLFIPQIFAALGIIFFYLFLKKYFSVAHSLMASFLIAVFIPHIYWSAQPLRETIGLFFFPLIIYLFDRVAANQRSGNIAIDKILLFLSLILISPSHYGSTLMIACWLIFYSIIFIKNTRKLLCLLPLMALFIGLAAAYWFFLFPRGIELILLISGFKPAVLFILVAAFFLFFRKYGLDLNKLKNKQWQFVSLCLSLIFLFIIIGRIAPIDYPIQIWLQFFILLGMIFVGFFKSHNKRINNLTLINAPFFILWLLSFYNALAGQNLKEMPFDPFRTLEFAIFPLSIVAATGFFAITKKIKHLSPFFIILLVFLSTFSYPSIYVYRTNFANTIFYDIRSDIRYISPAVRELIKWANDYNYQIISPLAELNAYQKVFFSGKDKTVIIRTSNDSLVLKNYSYINDPIAGVLKSNKWFGAEEPNNPPIIYSNEAGSLIRPIYDAEFISQNTPRQLNRGEKTAILIVMKNTGIKEWSSNDDFRLRFYNIPGGKIWGRGGIKISQSVLPNQSATSSIDIIAPDNPGDYDFVMRMFQTDIGWFGEITPPIKIRVLAVNKK